MTFEQLKQVVLDHCNLTSPEAIQRVGRSLNRHYARVTAKLSLDPVRFVIRASVTTPGLQTVRFTEIEKIDRLFDGSSPGTLRALSELSMHQMRSIMPGSGGPTRYAVQSTEAHAITVRLDTVSDAIFLLQADGRMTLGDLIGEEEPRFAASHHDILSNSVIYEELLKKEKPQLAAIYAQMAEKGLEDLQHEMADSATRDTQQWMPLPGMTAGSGGGGMFPHAETHETGGSDPLTALSADILTSGLLPYARLGPDVLQYPGGYPGGVDNYLRADGTFSLPPTGGTGGGPHAITHQAGGSDVLTALDAAILTGTLADARLTANVLRHTAGFPGGTTTFLRADGTFALPGEVVGSLAINEGLAFQSEFITTLTAATHNLAQGGGAPITHSIIKLDLTADWTLTGLVPPVPAGAYYFRVLINASTRTLTLAHNSTSSAAGNRFSLPLAADVGMQPGSMASLVYDKGAAIWRVLAIGGGGSGVRRIQTIDSDYSYGTDVETVIPLSFPLYDVAKTGINYLTPPHSTIAPLKRVRIINVNSIGVTLVPGSTTNFRTNIQLIEYA